MTGIKIVRTMIAEYYRAENGDHVALATVPDGTATLIICRPVNNEQYFRGEYKTRRSALIAMHRRCGKCEFVSMTHTYNKEGA